MTRIQRHWVYFIAQLALYGGMLFLDLALIDWYDSFYSAIQDKDQSKFIREIFVFILLALAQAVALGLIAFNSELYESQLKRHFVESWLKVAVIEVDAMQEAKADQRLIDDASLAAEKMAVLLPAVIFNSVKAIVFLSLLTQYPATLFVNVTDAPSLGNYILSFFGIIYIVVQYQVLKKANTWVFKSEKIKRAIEARTRYKVLSGGIVSFQELGKVCQRYVQDIIKIRVIVGRAHGINVVAINSISSLSFVVPFLVIFSTYASGSITFGELMKISATYSGFQLSALYVFNTYKEAMTGLAALNRLKLI